jgi:hypothetical protein
MRRTTNTINFGNELPLAHGVKFDTEGGRRRTLKEIYGPENLSRNTALGVAKQRRYGL